MMPPKITTKVESLLDREVRKVLVSESNYFALCNE